MSEVKNFAVSSQRIIEKGDKKFVQTNVAQFEFPNDQLPAMLKKLGDFLVKNGLEDFACKVSKEEVEVKIEDGKVIPVSE